MIGLSKKLSLTLKIQGMSPAQLGRAANLSRATMSRIMRGHIPSDVNLTRIAEVLDVSPGYLRGGYQLPEWLMEEDIIFLVAQKNAPLLRLVHRMEEMGLTVQEMKKITNVTL